MCVVDWGLVADWLSVALSAVTLWLAYTAIHAWQAQLMGTSRHAVAQEISTAARALRYAYYDTRSPLLEPWEFDESFLQLDGPTDVQRADAYRHAYQNRLKEMWPQLKALADCRAKVATVLGEAQCDAVENLAKRARRLGFYMIEHTKVIRAGDAVASWTDQAHVQKVKGVLATMGTDEPISNEFESAFNGLLTQLDGDLALGQKKTGGQEAALK